jgi:hypothetical protein
VEKAVGVINTVAAGKRIEKVEAIEDNIVFSGTTHDDFVRNSQPAPDIYPHLKKYNIKGERSNWSNS